MTHKFALAALTMFGFPICCFTVPAVAVGQTIPAANIYGSISSWDTGCDATLSGAGSVSGGCSLTTAGDVTVAAYYSNGAGLVSAVQNTYATGFNEIEYADARVTSYFEVVGPANSTVTLDLSASGTTSVSAAVGSSAEATASIINNQGTPLVSIGACSYIFYYCSGSTATGSLPSSFNVKQSFTVSSNTFYGVVVEAQGYSNAGGFSATVDPSVTFDSSFGSSGYSIVYSADASPSAPVPEPSPLILLGLGIPTLWLLRRRLLVVVNPSQDAVA